jgi:hypothetical protein
MGPTGYKPAASSNIYTVLVAIALLALIGGIVAVWLRGKELYGSSNPFDMTVQIQEPVKARPAAPAAEAAPAPAADATAPAAGATPPADAPASETPATPPAQ